MGSACCKEIAQAPKSSSGWAPKTWQKRVVDYVNVNSLWEALGSDDVVLVRGSWLVDHAAVGGVLPRRQACPLPAFMPVSELIDIREKSKRKMAINEYERAPVIAVSHFWREKGHPDREGITLRLIAETLKEEMKTYQHNGVTGVGVFFDWVSLYQDPRDSSEERAFKRSLKLASLWYAHSLTTVYLVTNTPEDSVAYHDRGWTSFEYQVSWLLRSSNESNVWPQVLDLGPKAESDGFCKPKGRPALVEPDAFKEGHVFGSKIFTESADRQDVAARFRETCEDIFASVTELNFDGVGWGNDEVDGLGTVLPLCQKLRNMNLSRNLFTSLPDSLGQLLVLQVLNLSDCTLLSSLPEKLGQLKALEELHVSGCSSLKSLPDSIGQSQALRLLYLTNCSSLHCLPESIGRLQALEVLDLICCSSLSSLPESTVQLQALKELNLTRCSALRCLPENICQLQALKVLDLIRCSSLSSLPESFGRLQALESLDLSGCTSLSRLPDSMGQLKRLEVLNLKRCSSLSSLPETIGQLQALQEFNLEECRSLSKLPESTGQLQELHQLTLFSCNNLGGLPESLVKLRASKSAPPKGGRRLSVYGR